MIQYSFIDVCQKEFKGIEIPLIQRDYAQGRKQEKKKRYRFLKALYEAVKGPGISLDFIYGSITKDDKLIPLDGQQRLTTLFLLHWYAAKRDGIAKDKWECLNKFTYSTRISARRFCEHLLEFTPDFESKDPISAQIHDEAWYSLAWDNDPTVASMSQMLDDIAITFDDVDDLWNELCHNKKITFYFDILEDMGITDDIYIKMNSRGKPLTDFEHFKAELTDLIKREDFSLKIDKDWTNMLWPYRGENNIIDEEFLAYFHFITDVICIKTGVPLIGPKQNVGINNGYFEMIKVYQDEKNVDLLERFFDCWCEITDIDNYFSSYLANLKYEKSKVKVYEWNTNLFKDCCENYQGVGKRGSSFTINKIIMLYAFVIRNTKGKDIDDKIFRRRLRILRNLVWNSIDELRKDRMKRLLEETEQIILKGHISVNKEDRGFNRQQKEEECDKLIWCENHSAYVESLFHLEDHQLLYGCTAIAELEKPDRIEKLRTFLNMDLQTISRALLIYGDYGQTINNYKQIANGTSEVWKQLLHPSKQRSGFGNTRRMISALLENCRVGTKEELNEQINCYLQAKETPKDWRYYFIKYPCILLKPTNGKYDMKNNYELNIMSANTYRGRYWDAISLAIYNKYRETKTLSMDNWGNPLTLLSSENKLINRQEYFIITDKEGTTLDKVRIPQSNGLDNEDRVELALSLINKYEIEENGTK